MFPSFTYRRSLISFLILISVVTLLAFSGEVYKGIIGMAVKSVKTLSGEEVCKLRIVKRDLKLEKGQTLYLYSASQLKAKGVLKLSAKGYVYIKVNWGKCQPGLSVRLVPPSELSYLSETRRDESAQETTDAKTSGTSRESVSSSSSSQKSNGYKKLPPVKLKELPPVTPPYSRREVRDPYADIHIPMDKINDGMRYYTSTLASHTVVLKFGGKKPKQVVKVKLDPTTLMDLYFTYSQFQYMNEMSRWQSSWGYSTPGMDSMKTFMYLGLLSQLYSLFNPPKVGSSLQEMGLVPKVPESYVMVIYLDEHVAMARTIFHAYKETIYDEPYLKRYYINLLDRTKIRDLAVFKVEIFNGSPVGLPLSPFAYRMYLIGANGRRYKAVKYDPQLDTTVPPRGKVSGFIYFPKYDMVTGERLVRGTVKISIEEIGPIRQKILKFR